MSKGGYIDKLKKIIFEHIEDEKFGVSQLAEASGVSRSQLLRKVKAHTGKSATQLISEIRLERSLKLLEEEEFTAAEISYKVGFSSPSYFNKCFLERYGVTPGEYKRKLEQGEITHVVEDHPENIHLKKYVYGILMIALIIAGIALITRSDMDASPVKKSIAILPLLDLTGNTNMEYLADGITEAITMDLSKNKSFRVISRGSSMVYKGERVPYPEIARELGVDLLLEGSLLYSGDTMRVVVQLIEPIPEEKHIWANVYEQYHSNIFKLSGIISKDINERISGEVSVDIKTPSMVGADPEAYDLYLRGRHIWNNQKTQKEALVKALGYLKESINKDPGFAPAYVTLAETYLSINTLSGDQEEKTLHRKMALKAINKALNLDASLAEAYITKGGLIGKLYWDWEGMKKLAEKGLQLDSNNPNAHLQLSDYYVVKNQYQKAMEEALVAASLDPLNPDVGYVVAQRYYIAGLYEKSVKKFEEVIELHPGYGWAYDGLGFAWLKIGNQEKAVTSWKKLQQINGNALLYQCYNENDFTTCLDLFLENAGRNEPRFCSNPMIISSICMITDDMHAALNYLEIAFRYRSENLPIMITYPDFYPLHHRDDFKEIARKTGVILPVRTE